MLAQARAGGEHDGDRAGVVAGRQLLAGTRPDALDKVDFDGDRRLRGNLGASPKIIVDAMKVY